MKLTLDISTCPNDTFMFDAALHGRIDTEGLSFDLTLADIEQLNDAVIRNEPDITKLSYAVYPLVKENYRILDSGSALGRGNGPLVVSRHKIYTDELHDARVAIPGEHTTANLLLKRLFPCIKSKRSYLFSNIAEAVLDGECDAGVLIHEGRFTYKKKGLLLVADLGEEWEKQTSLPLPLGAIAVSNRVDKDVQQKIERVVRRSVEYALANPAASAAFVKQHAQELSEEITAQHIGLFVNDFSVSLGKEGRRAVVKLLGIEEKDIFV